MDQSLTKTEKKALRQEETHEKEAREKKQHFYKTIGWWSFGGLLLVLAIWALVAFSSNSTTSSSSSADIAMPKITINDFQSNTTGAQATLTEYADFECPACKAYYPLVKQLQTDFGSKLNVVYRLFPLKTVHPNAVNAAKAALAAAKQGKFWQMHDVLFDKQNDWATLTDPESTFTSYAKGLGLNTTQFQKDYADPAIAKTIDDAYSNDLAMGLNSTPTFFLNGKLLTNPQSYQEFKTDIQNALK